MAGCTLCAYVSRAGAWAGLSDCGGAGGDRGGTIPPQDRVRLPTGRPAAKWGLWGDSEGKPPNDNRPVTADNEEELVCFWIPEGVAATINSDDSWLVFGVDHADEASGAEVMPATSVDGGALP